MTATRIKLRNGTASEWTSANPILAAGEPGVESDTSKVKYGDGVTAWNALAYASSGVTDHGALTGLGDDDHPQYLNNARGDARFDALGAADTAEDNAIAAAATDATTKANAAQAAAIAAAATDATTKASAAQAAAIAAAAIDATTKADAAEADAATSAAGLYVPVTRTVNGHALSGNVSVTKSDVGLGNADNTSDANKPVSTATQTALDAKLDDSQASAFGLTLIDDADATAARATLGLGTLATQSGTFSGTHSGTSSGTNTGDQTSIVGITGSLAEFNAALTGADFATGGGTVSGTSSGTNTGDQTSIVGITGTLAQFNTAVSDDNLAGIGAANAFTAGNTFASTVDILNGGTFTYRAAGANGIQIGAGGTQLASGLGYKWTSGNANGTVDTGMHRNAAGVVEVNNGSAGTFRDLKIRNVLAAGGNGSYVQVPTMTVANLAAAATAGFGALAAVSDANATTARSTVAGGGANKVLVMSDGTNWLIMG